MMTRPSTFARGFSLIEMLVAMVILALSLGVLYQAAAGATRNVRVDERFTYAVQLAQSLLAEYPTLRPEGVDRSGVAGDFNWQLRSTPYGAGPVLQGPAGESQSIDLLQLEAIVRWGGTDARETTLVTVVPVQIEQEVPGPIDGL